MILGQPKKGGPRQMQHAGQDNRGRRDLPGPHQEQGKTADRRTLAAAAEIAATSLIS